MPLYKFKVSFEDYEDVIRVIEIKPEQTLEDLHLAILKSVDFKDGELASFYLSDDQWKKGKEYTLTDMAEDMEDETVVPTPTMSATPLNELIYDPHQKLIYVYDMMAMWTFHVEFAGISMKEDSKITYPYCSKSEGLAPKQVTEIKIPNDIDLEEDFDALAATLIAAAGGVESDEHEDDDDEETSSLYGDSVNEDDASEFNGFSTTSGEDEEKF